jgi:anti-anti-sigma factor
MRSVGSMAASPGLDLSWEDGPDGVRIARLSGVIEATAVSLIADELSREIERAPRAFVFDLAKVEYISSSGWGQFARAFDATRSVALVGMGPDLFDVYECLEFRSFIPAYATEAQALRTLATSGPEPAGAPPLAAPAPRPRGRAAADSPDAAPAPAHDEGLDDVLSSAAPKSPRSDAPHGSRNVPGVDANEEPPIWGRREWKDQAAPSDVDVDAAVSDRNKDRDKKLRTMGWERYGKRLREQSDDAPKDAGDDESPGDDER